MRHNWKEYYLAAKTEIAKLREENKELKQRLAQGYQAPEPFIPDIPPIKKVEEKLRFGNWIKYLYASLLIILFPSLRKEIRNEKEVTGSKTG